MDFVAKDAVELHYRRKHPNLHGWMESAYRDKGGADESFNYVNLELTTRWIAVFTAARLISHPIRITPSAKRLDAPFRKRIIQYIAAAIGFVLPVHRFSGQPGRIFRTPRWVGTRTVSENCVLR